MGGPGGLYDSLQQGYKDQLWYTFHEPKSQADPIHLPGLNISSHLS